MSNVVDLKAGIHLSISNLAGEMGMARETVSKRLVEAGVRPSGKRRGYPVYRLRDALPALTGTGETQDPDELDPFKRRAFYQGELEKMKVAHERGELIPRIEVEREQARILGAVAHFFDTLPDVIERDVGATPAQLEAIEDAADQIRESLYSELMAEDEDADSTACDSA